MHNTIALDHRAWAAHIEQRLLDQLLQVSDGLHQPLVQQGHYKALPWSRAPGVTLVRAVWCVKGPVDESDDVLAQV